MLFDSITLANQPSNLTIDSGTDFPSSPDNGELFYRSDEHKTYIYTNSQWTMLGGSTAVVPKILNVYITTALGTVLDDTAVNTAGGYVKITGSGFDALSKVYVDFTEAAVTYASASEIRCTVPALTAGNKTIYVVNPDGSTGVKLNGLTYSPPSSWITSADLGYIISDKQINIQLQATDAVSFALSTGSSLPTGLSLSSAGLITGSISVQAQSSFSFSVTATDAENQESERTFSMILVPGSDVNFNNTVLLLEASSTNAANNTAFIDSSASAAAITATGDVMQTSLTPFSPSGWSVYYSGSVGDVTSFAANTAFNIRSSQVTFEAWVYPTARSTGALPTNQSNIVDFYSAYNNRYGINVSSAGFLQIYSDGAIKVSTSTTTIPLNAWTHVAWTWDGTNNKFYVNGVDVTSTFANPNLDGTFPRTISSPSINIGSSNYSNSGYTWVDPFTGYISNARLVKGSLVYTSSFSPPTSPLTAIANTLFLCNSRASYRDISSNNYAVVVGGNVKISALSPISPSAEYSASTHGGSAYFDGTGDYLTAPNSTAFDIGTGDFTIEYWVYPTTLSTNGFVILDKRASATASAWTTGVDSTGKAYLYNGTTNLTTSSAININSWSHIALSRSSGTLKIFINGVEGYSAANSTNLTTANALTIGGIVAGGTGYTLNGYLSSLRIIKGTATYTSGFTPSTSPLTAVSGTSLLLNFSGVNIYDATTRNALKPSGGTAVTDTSVKKFNSSVYIPSGVTLTAITREYNLVGTGDFTVEMWIYPTSVATTHSLFSTRGGGDVQHMGFDIQIFQSLLRSTTNNFIYITGSTPVRNNEWQHVALSRSGSNMRLFLNGVLQGTYTTNQNFYYNAINIGGINTYIEDFRMMKTALYTSNFTVPAFSFLQK